MSVKIVFLNSKLDEKIFMQPTGFVAHGQRNNLCKWQYSICYLWYEIVIKTVEFKIP